MHNSINLLKNHRIIRLHGVNFIACKLYFNEAVLKNTPWLLGSWSGKQLRLSEDLFCARHCLSPKHVLIYWFLHQTYGVGSSIISVTQKRNSTEMLGNLPKVTKKSGGRTRLQGPALTHYMPSLFGIRNGLTNRQCWFFKRANIPQATDNFSPFQLLFFFFCNQSPLRLYHSPDPVLSRFTTRLVLAPRTLPREFKMGSDEPDFPGPKLTAQQLLELTRFPPCIQNAFRVNYTVLCKIIWAHIMLIYILYIYRGFTGRK